MGFRQTTSTERERAWPAWIHEHRETLCSIGLPLETFVDLRSWDQFAECGDVYAPRAEGVARGFHFGDLQRGQMHALLRLLEQTDDFRPAQSSLLGFLRVRLAEEPSC